MVGAPRVSLEQLAQVLLAFAANEIGADDLHRSHLGLRDGRVVEQQVDAVGIEPCTHDVGRLVITGAQSDACIISTLHGAATRGYGALLVSDAHTTEDLTEYGGAAPESVIAHTNLMWGMHGVPGRETGTVTTADVDFS